MGKYNGSRGVCRLVGRGNEESRGKRGGALLGECGKNRTGALGFLMQHRSEDEIEMKHWLLALVH